jgi:hypothetical protein
MEYCQGDPWGCTRLVEESRLLGPRVMEVVDQRRQLPQSLLDALKQHRQVHEADPRTNRAIYLVQEEDPEIRGELVDDGSDADNLRKQAYLVRGTLRANIVVVLLRL